MGVPLRSACSLGLTFFSTQKRRQTREERQWVTLLQEVPGSGLPKVGAIDPERKNSVLIPDSAQDRVTSQPESIVTAAKWASYLSIRVWGREWAVEAEDKLGQKGNCI